MCGYDCNDITYLAVLGDDLDISARRYIDMNALQDSYQDLGMQISAAKTRQSLSNLKNTEFLR